MRLQIPFELVVFVPFLLQRLVLVILYSFSLNKVIFYPEQKKQEF